MREKFYYRFNNASIYHINPRIASVNCYTNNNHAVIIMVILLTSVCPPYSYVVMDDLQECMFVRNSMNQWPTNITQAAFELYLCFDIFRETHYNKFVFQGFIFTLSYLKPDRPAYEGGLLPHGVVCGQGYNSTLVLASWSMGSQISGL